MRPRYSAHPIFSYLVLCLDDVSSISLRQGTHAVANLNLARNYSVLCGSKRVSMKRAIGWRLCLRPLLCWKFHHIFELVLPGAAVASLEEDLMSLILPLLVALNDVVSLLKSCLLATSFKKPPGYENPVLLANETACESPYLSLTKLCSCLVRSIILIHSGMNAKVRMSCSSGREVLSAMAESWQPSFGFPKV